MMGAWTVDNPADTEGQPSSKEQSGERHEHQRSSLHQRVSYWASSVVAISRTSPGQHAVVSPGRVDFARLLFSRAY